MDKQLLKAYIRTIVEEEVQRILPEMLSEAVQQVKQLSESSNATPVSSKKPFDRRRFAELMGSPAGDTFTASTKTMPLPENAPRDVDEKVIEAVTKDYSVMMKKLGLT